MSDLVVFGSRGFGLTTLGAGDEVAHWLNAFEVVAAGAAAAALGALECAAFGVDEKCEREKDWEECDPHGNADVGRLRNLGRA